MQLLELLTDKEMQSPATWFTRVNTYAGTTCQSSVARTRHPRKHMAAGVSAHVTSTQDPHETSGILEHCSCNLASRPALMGFCLYHVLERSPLSPFEEGLLADMQKFVWWSLWSGWIWIINCGPRCLGIWALNPARPPCRPSSCGGSRIGTTGQWVLALAYSFLAWRKTLRPRTVKPFKSVVPPDPSCCHLSIPYCVRHSYFVQCFSLW